MKPSKPELSANWWSAVRPSGVDEKKELEKSLARAEKAIKEQEKKTDDERVTDNCLGALSTLPNAVKKALRDCDKKKDKEVIGGLKTLNGIIDAELVRLEQLKKKLAAGEADEDEDESEGKLFEKEYLHKLIKLIKSGGKELNFAFGLDMNAPEACDFLLHRKKSSEMLFKILKKTKKFPNRLLTYGIAKTDSTDKQTLVFNLAPSANTPPKKILRIGRKLFQFDKKLRFKKLKVIASNGETFEDTEPDDDAAEETATASTTAAAGGQAKPQEEMFEISKKTQETLLKAPAVWQETRRTIANNLSQLKTAIRKEFASEGREAIAEIDQNMKAVDGVLVKLDDRLATSLTKAGAAKDRAAFEEELQATIAILADYENYVASEPLIAHIDANPFGVKMGLEKAISDSLKNVARVVSTASEVA